MNQEELTDRDRFPLLNEQGREMLDRLRQHPHAPHFNYHCGEKLTAAGLQRVRDFAQQTKQARPSWTTGSSPGWRADYVRHCWHEVPYYRQRDALLRERWLADDFAAERLPWTELPLTGREHLRQQPWSFVPDTMELDDLIVYSTSGTTGNLLRLICDPTVPARYLPLFERALADYGVRLEGARRVSILHVAAQRSTYTLVSTISYFDFAGFAKVNLHPDQWKHASDREAFIDDCHAELYTGDPFALAELAKLSLSTRPKAILSSATTLLPAVRKQLQNHFGCPVVDIYSMNETGPIAYSWGDQMRIFPHQLFVEVVDDRGQPVAPGSEGEIVVTGGVNPWMPLLRYRTGDRAAMNDVDGYPTLFRFSGRTPVHFYDASGRLIRSIDIIVALYDLPLPVFHLHQAADGTLLFRTCCDAHVEEKTAARLRVLFGPATPLTMEPLPDTLAWQGKAIQFTSDFDSR